MHGQNDFKHLVVVCNSTIRAHDPQMMCFANILKFLSQAFELLFATIVLVSVCNHESYLSTAICPSMVNEWLFKECIFAIASFHMICMILATDNFVPCHN